MLGDSKSASRRWRTPAGRPRADRQSVRVANEVHPGDGGHDLFKAHPAVPGLLSDFFLGRPSTTRLLLLPAPTVVQSRGTGPSR